jgi:viroplasmin and RNaseH domain-containing protein
LKGYCLKKSEIKNKVNCAIKTLKERDYFLIKYRLHEETLSHRLAVYLENIFPKEYDVDCEYNKKIDVQIDKVEDKSVRKNIQSSGSTRTIRPDITIHKRGRNNRKANLLVIQLKKKENLQGRDKDEDALRELTKQDGKYRYQYGLFLDIDNDTSKITPRWFENGEEENTHNK